MLAAAALGMAPAARAVDDTKDLNGREACKIPGKSTFKFPMYYSSDERGAYRNTLTDSAGAPSPDHRASAPVPVEAIKRAAAKAKSAR
ncbi:hypothetical protein O1L68_34725 [Streptomyces lydicus]|nr:hypothetical protein [Streptomyces lydicus]